MADAPLESAPQASPPPPPPRPAPVAPGERIEDIDILRGCALFGVLLMNVLGWFRGSVYENAVEPRRFPGTLDRIVHVGARVLVEQKAMTLFALLFGVGMALQADRNARAGRPRWLLARRMLVLLGIGAVHTLLVWTGDVLHFYALLGLVSLLFLTQRTRTVAIVAGILFALLPVIDLVSTFLAYRAGRPLLPSPDVAALRALYDDEVRVYASGGFLENLRFRLTNDYPNYVRAMPPYLEHILALFALGALIFRSGVLERPAEHRVALVRTLIAGLVLGYAFEITFAFHPGIGDSPAHPGLWRLLLGVLFLCRPALTLAYAAGLLLLLQRPAVRAWMAPIGRVGRMALTSYLSQSVICSLIYFGFGLGLYGKLGPAANVAIVIGVYAAQVALSGAWLARFRFGPVEWVWRSLTYGEAQPMRLPKAAMAPVADAAGA